MDLPDILTRPKAADCGLSPSEWNRATADRARVACGAYASTRHLTAEQLHEVRTRAVLERLRNVAASHVSAAVVRDLPVPNGELALVHVTPTTERLGRPKSGRYHRMHSRPIPEERLGFAKGIPVTDDLLTVTDCARLLDQDWGVVVVDAALHRGSITPEDLAQAVAELRGVAGVARARRLPYLVSSLSESPGESLTRLRIRRMGLDADEQVWIGGDRVDFVIDDCLVVEFDGRGKYAMNGDPERAYWNEKARNDRLSEGGYEVLHITWAELWDEPALALRIMGALARARARRGRVPSAVR